MTGRGRCQNRLHSSLGSVYEGQRLMTARCTHGKAAMAPELSG
jgi:hypothetical protein